MHPVLIILSASLGLFLGMLLMYEIGRGLGLATIKHDPGGLNKGVGAAESAVFALLGLIIAFTFSGAGERFESRRAMITEEANDIGTAYQRLDLLPSDAQPALRDLFRQYAELRATPPQIETVSSADDWYAATNSMQANIWKQALAASQRADADSHATLLLLPAMNSMFDITNSRERATKDHPPLAIYLLLAGLSFLAALLVGHALAGNKRRNLLHPMAFAAIISLSVYLILDMEYPRVGLIVVNQSDIALLDVRKSMN